MTYFARVTDQGEIVLPADVAQAIGLRPGDRFRIDHEGSDVVLQSDADVIEAGRRAYLATIKRPFTVDDFIADRRIDAKGR